jgi:hypothetical protein
MKYMTMIESTNFRLKVFSLENNKDCFPFDELKFQEVAEKELILENGRGSTPILVECILRLKFKKPLQDGSFCLRYQDRDLGRSEILISIYEANSYAPW